MKVIVDYRASKETFDALLKLGYNIIKTPRLDSVYDAISGHPDIMFHKITDGLAICEPSVCDYFRMNLPEYSIIAGKTNLKSKYPKDIAYNVCALTDKILCNINHTDDKILHQYIQRDYEIINIKQGYAKCSICIVSDNAIITSDSGIFNTASKYDIDVLMVDDTEVKLPGLNHGFIGGASGLVSQNKLLLNGDIAKHPNHKEIVEFCKQYRVEVISLNQCDIVDIGSIIAV